MRWKLLNILTQEKNNPMTYVQYFRQLVAISTWMSSLQISLLYLHNAKCLYSLFRLQINEGPLAICPVDRKKMRTWYSAVEHLIRSIVPHVRTARVAIDELANKQFCCGLAGRNARWQPGSSQHSHVCERQCNGSLIRHPRTPSSQTKALCHKARTSLSLKDFRRLAT